MKTLLAALAAITLGGTASALAGTTVIVTDDAPAGPTSVSACAFAGLPPMLMYRLETPRFLGWWVQVGDNQPVELNVAAQFMSWEFDGNEYYLVDDLSVTKKGSTQSTKHKSECISLIAPS